MAEFLADLLEEDDRIVKILINLKIRINRLEDSQMKADLKELGDVEGDKCHPLPLLLEE